jgi:hypothetical protein
MVTLSSTGADFGKSLMSLKVHQYFWLRNTPKKGVFGVSHGTFYPFWQFLT